MVIPMRAFCMSSIEIVALKKFTERLQLYQILGHYLLLMRLVMMASCEQ
jgi:hypothetical protein